MRRCSEGTPLDRLQAEPTSYLQRMASAQLDEDPPVVDAPYYEQTVANISATLRRLYSGASQPLPAPANTATEEAVPLIVDVEQGAAEGAAAGAASAPAAAAATAAAAAGAAASSSGAGEGRQSNFTDVIRTLAQHGPAAAVVAAAGAAQPPAAADAAGAPPETAAAAAERHRLANSSNVNIQAFAKWLELGLPYLLILLSIFVWQHFIGIAVSTWLLLCQIRGNAVLRDAVGRRQSYGLSELAGHLLYIVLNALVVLWLTSRQQLYRLFTFSKPLHTLTVWQAFFLALVADSLLRFSSMAPKLLLVAGLKPFVMGNARAQRRQARLLTLTEYAVSWYRALVPVRVWYSYLGSATVNHAIASSLSVLYLVVKLYHIMRRGRLVVSAAQMVVRSGALYGQYVSKAEAGEAATCCPICQEPADRPVQLQCSHSFCEECISEWLERHQTCPMCRKLVKDPGLENYGDGSTPLLPLLF